MSYAIYRRCWQETEQKGSKREKKQICWNKPRRKVCIYDAALVIRSFEFSNIIEWH